MHPVEVLLIRQMSRYTNGQKIAQWKRWVEDTVERSRQMGGLAIVVVKASQEFRLYQNGILRQNYPANLGFSGLQDKLYEGDGATPEGIFHIVQKKREGETKFHKAFMLDFPNPLQQRQFQVAKTKGFVPANRRIGGLIEIHGQWPGQRDLTNGCVSLDNAFMNKLFPLVSVNTPVVIVGALDPTNSVSEALAPIHHHHLQRNLLARPTSTTLSRPSVE
jgi:murein L,D-transpeptidase YafK